MSAVNKFGVQAALRNYWNAQPELSALGELVAEPVPPAQAIPYALVRVTPGDIEWTSRDGIQAFTAQVLLRVPLTSEGDLKRAADVMGNSFNWREEQFPKPDGSKAVMGIMPRPVISEDTKETSAGRRVVLLVCEYDIHLHIPPPAKYFEAPRNG